MYVCDQLVGEWDSEAEGRQGRGGGKGKRAKEGKGVCILTCIIRTGSSWPCIVPMNGIDERRDDDNDDGRLTMIMGE